jgi:mitochondrial-processing peptidase subunit alpha
MRRTLLSPRVFRTRRPPIPLHSLHRRNLVTSSKSLLSAIVDPLSRDPSELTQISTLPNGIRVATEALPGHYSCLGLFLDAGSRYEPNHLYGVSHVVDRLAYHSTKSHSGAEIIQKLEWMGGNSMCQASREHLAYQSSVFNNDVPEMLGLMAETVREPLLTEEEVELQKETVLYEVREIKRKPEQIVPEYIHRAAYGDATLGRSVLCPEERLPYINVNSIQEYRSLFYRPERMTFAFAGVNHDTAVRLVEQYFGDMQSPSSSGGGGLSSSISNSISTLLGKQPSLNASTPLAKPMSTVTQGVRAPPIITTAPRSHYTGGTLRYPHPPTHDGKPPEFTYVYLAFESVPVSSPDIYALATLQILLGGGGSFSAGGPGKGMYSRLYTNVLNQYGWVESCVGFSNSYSDSGVFGIGAAVQRDATHAIVDVICRELALLAHDGRRGITRMEADRAKKQLKSSLLMNLESRIVEMDDLGKQVALQGFKTPVKEMCDRIDALTITDLRNLAEKVVTGAVVNAVKGTGKVSAVIMGEGEDEASQVGDLEATVALYGLGSGGRGRVNPGLRRRF